MHRIIRINKQYRMAGFSLVEIMISLLIGLFIIAGAITILVQNQQNYRQNDDFGRLQENVRFAMDLIIDDLRGAGFFGCSNKLINNLNNATTGTLFDTDQPIDGFESGQASWTGGNTDVIASIHPDTDAITIRRLLGRGVPILNTMASADALIDINNAPVNVGQLAAIYNCSVTNIFQVTSSDTNADTLGHSDAGGFSPGNASADFLQPLPPIIIKYAYAQNTAYSNNPAAFPDGLPANTFVAPFVPVRYYIAASEADPARTSLWRQYHDGAQLTTQELVDGIENMQLLYGQVPINSDIGYPTAYTTADNIIGTESWKTVVAVKLTLLVSTTEQSGLDIDTKTYDIYSTPDNTNDDVGPFNDRRNRQMISATVLLRNVQMKPEEIK
jgi:type IV pilus assembly protein PilW